MTRILFYIVLLTLIINTLSAQERLTSSGELPIMAWSGIPPLETNIERFRELKEMGININLINFSNAGQMEQGLELAKQVGFGLIASCPELKTDPEKTVTQFKNHPSLAGYFLRDEPVRKDFAELGEWAKKITAIDPDHICFVNLIASINLTKTEALGTASYAEYVSTFAKEVPQKILSFDFYPVLNQGIHENWYHGLEVFSSEARKLNKPFWAFALASSYNELHPVPTVAALRLQQYSNLAYGAQGLEYWSYWMSQGLRCAPIDLNGKRTVVYDRIKEVNNEIQTLAGVFVGSKVVSVRHTGTIIPKGTTRLTTLPAAIKVFETEGSGALVSTLENGKNTFFLVLNRDLNNSMTLVISGDESLKRVLKDGRIISANKYSPKLEIEPGDVAIYRFPTPKTVQP